MSLYAGQIYIMLKCAITRVRFNVPFLSLILLPNFLCRPYKTKCCIDFYSICVYGGGSMKNQITTVRKGVEIIVATPGRLNDLIAKDIIKLNSITYLVSI